MHTEPIANTPAAQSMRFLHRLLYPAALLSPIVVAAQPKTVASAQPSAAASRVVAKGTSPDIAALYGVTRAQLSGERAREMVVFMDQWFRVPGNTGFNASLDRVESILKAAGYVSEATAASAARLVYRVESKALRGPAWDPADASITIEGQATPLMQWSTNRNMLAINSWSTPDTGLVAELVYAGAGRPPDLDSLNVKGKFVVAEAALGAVFTDAVVRRGAAGVLAYRMPAYTQPDVHRNSVQFTSIPYDTLARSLGIALSRNGIDGLRAALARGPVKLRIKATTRFYPSTNRTVIAEVRGTVAPNERFVFSAHAQEPGANDNATGVGALADMARVLALLNRSGTAVPKRTITMLFGNEIEQTRDFLAADSARTRDVRWGLSLDMVGEDTKKTGGTFLIEKMPDPSAIWTRGEDKHSEWGGSAITKDRVRPHYFNDYLLARALDQAAASDWVVRTNPFEGGSDHTPFLTANKPGVLFWHFTDVFYHTDGDRPENVSATTLYNVENAALVSALVLASANGATARALVAEVERAAIKRLDTELALSQKVVAGGGSAASERDILETWTGYYVKSLGSMSDIEVGGSSPETTAAIAAAQNHVEEAGLARLAQLTSK